MQQDVAARYLALREITKRLNNEIMDMVVPATFTEWARRIGLGHSLDVASEEERVLVMDLCVHAAKPGRTRAIDRFAQSARAPTDPEAAGVLKALRASKFSLWRVARPHPDVGLIVLNVVTEEETWLIDIGMAQSMKPGAGFAARLFWPGDFAMSAGIVIPMSGDLLLEMLEGTPLLRSGIPEVALMTDPRFPVAVFRTAIAFDVMDRVRFRDPNAVA